MHLYPNKFKNWFLSASALPQIFHPKLAPCPLALPLALDKKFEAPPCQIPNSSSCLSIAIILGIFPSSVINETPSIATARPVTEKPIVHVQEADPTLRVPVKGARVYLIGDFLYWNAQEEGLNFSYIAKGQSQTLPLSDVKIPQFNSEWNTGFRVGLGYRLPHDLWEAKGYVTQFRTTNHLDKTAHSNAFIQPNFGQLPAIESFAHEVGNWHLKFKLIDIALSRSYPVSKALAVTPFLGARGAWIHQTLHTKFTNPSSLEVEEKSHYAAGGLRLGSDLNFYLMQYFSFFGQASVSLLSGRFELESHLSASEDTLYSAKGKPHRLSANAELRGGISGTIPLYRKQAYLTLGLTYDMSIWFAQNQFLSFFSAQNALQTQQEEGNLTLQGVSFSTRLDF